MQMVSSSLFYVKCPRYFGTSRVKPTEINRKQEVTSINTCVISTDVPNINPYFRKFNEFPITEFNIPCTETDVNYNNFLKGVRKDILNRIAFKNQNNYLKSVVMKNHDALSMSLLF